MTTTRPTILPIFATLEKTLKGALVLICGGYILLDLYIIFSRIFYRYELDGLEGEGLVQVYRLLAGQPLYVKPSLAYVPMIYPPLYYCAAALVSKIAGPGFGAMRLVSILSTFLCATILFLAVKENTKNHFAGWAAVGCFASLFMLTDQWFDIARPDMLASALSFLAVYLAREREPSRNPGADLAAGVIFSLAFFTKQQALFVFLALAAYYAVFNWCTALRISGAFIITSAFLCGYFWLNTGGWFFYYLFTVPAAHKFALTVGGVISALLSQFMPIPILLVAGILPVLLSPRQILGNRTYRYYFAAALALIAAGTIGYLNKFAARNVMVASYLGVSLLLGLAVNRVVAIARSVDRANPRQLLFAAGWLILILQFGFQFPAFTSARSIPTRADRAAGDEMVAKIKSFPGDVLAIDDNYLLLYANKPVVYSEMSMSEVAGEGSHYAMPEWPALQNQIHQLIHAPTTSALIVDYYGRIQKDIAGCAIEKIRFADKNTFLPVTGYQTRPKFIISCNANQR